MRPKRHPKRHLKALTLSLCVCLVLTPDAAADDASDELLALALRVVTTEVTPSERATSLNMLMTTASALKRPRSLTQIADAVAALPADQLRSPMLLPLGTILIEHRLWKPALKLTEALDKHCAKPRCRVQIGMSYLSLGEFSRGWNLVRSALPQSERTHWRAISLAHRGQHSEALALIIQERPPLSSLQKLALLQLQLDKPDAVAATIAHALTLVGKPHVEAASPLAELADIAVKAKQHALASTVALAAAKASRSPSKYGGTDRKRGRSVLLALTSVWAELGDRERVRNSANDLLKHIALTPDTMFLHGSQHRAIAAALLKVDDQDGAQNILQGMAKLLPQHDPGIVPLTTVAVVGELAAAGDFEAAKQLAHKMSSGWRLRGLIALAQGYATRGATKQATETMSRAHALYDTLKAPQLWSELAKGYRRTASARLETMVTDALKAASTKDALTRSDTLAKAAEALADEQGRLSAKMRLAAMKLVAPPSP